MQRQYTQKLYTLSTSEIRSNVLRHSPYLIWDRSFLGFFLDRLCDLQQTERMKYDVDTDMTGSSYWSPLFYDTLPKPPEWSYWDDHMPLWYAKAMETHRKKHKWKGSSKDSDSE